MASAPKDYWRSHQVPMGEMHENPAHVSMLETVDEELPTRRAVRRQRAAPARAGRTCPAGIRRMSANPHANGGLLLRDLGCRISAITLSK